MTDHVYPMHSDIPTDQGCRICTAGAAGDSCPVCAATGPCRYCPSTQDSAAIDRIPAARPASTRSRPIPVVGIVDLRPTEPPRPSWWRHLLNKIRSHHE